jgi:DNA-binding SARP family transcriptional activator
MAFLQVFMFRDFEIYFDGQQSKDIEGRKPKELLAFLLLNQERPHRRETLATLLWEESGEKAQRNMRQALWQLQRELEKHAAPDDLPLLLVDAEWLQINPAAATWCDVLAFRLAYERVRGLEGNEITQIQADDLRTAIHLYRGGLLEGWYLDWCLVDREHLQNILLLMLDKLIDYCEMHQLYEEGINHGMRSLKVDNARERTHRRLMRHFAHIGDRSAALRQYHQCTLALEQEFGLSPSALTTQLYERIRKDEPLTVSPMQLEDVTTPAQLVDLPRLSQILTQITIDLVDAHQRIVRDLENLADYLHS